MKKLYATIIFAAFFCSVISSAYGQKPEFADAAIEIAIADFLKCRSSKGYNVFAVSIYERGKYDPYKIGDDFIAVGILPVQTSYPNFIPWFDTMLGIEITPREYYITSVDTLGSTRLPTRHIIKDEKLFYWHDPNYSLTKETIDAFLKFNIAERIDISDLSLLIGYEGHIDDAIKATGYYFCKSNLANYKRVVSNIAIGWYKPPKLKCK